MNSNNTHEPWLDKAIQDLRKPVAPSIAGQLRAARRTALQSTSASSTRSYWQWVLAASILVVSTLSFIVIQYSTSESSPVVATTVPSTVIDDLPIMTAQDDLQFYQDLDFIQWLAKDSKGGQS